MPIGNDFARPSCILSLYRRECVLFSSKHKPYILGKVLNVLSVLAMKGIEYEYKPVDLMKDGGQQHSTEYNAINPMEQVPTLVIGDLCLTQSVCLFY